MIMHYTKLDGSVEDIEIPFCKDCIHFCGREREQDADVILCDSLDKTVELDQASEIPFKMCEYIQSGNIAILAPIEMDSFCEMFKERE